MACVDQEARKAYNREYARRRYAERMATDPEYAARKRARENRNIERRKREEEGYAERRKADYQKWYDLQGKENARGRKGYESWEDYLLRVGEKRRKMTEYMREWAKTPAGRRNVVVSACRKYGIQVEDYEQAWNQQEGKCWICGKFYEKFPPSGQERLAIDHCHTTGRFRALLCRPCNSVVGLLGENQEKMERMIQYLQEVVKGNQ